MTSTRVIIILGGDAPDPRVRHLIPTDAYVIAADRGVDHALALGLLIDLAVGDMDSVSLAGLAHLQQERIPTERHPTDKEASDGELAIDAALRQRPDEVYIVCGGGQDRFDHLMITAALLTHPLLAGREVTAYLGDTMIVPVQSGERRQFVGQRDATVTLLAVNGPAVGVTTTGLTFALNDETLQPWSSRGLSNRIESDVTLCSVSVQRGALLIIRPDALRDVPI